MSQERWWYLSNHRKCSRLRRARKRQAPSSRDVAHRRQFGHWEGDLSLFKQSRGQSNVTSLVKRVSRFNVLLENPNERTKPVMGKTANAVRDLATWPGNPLHLTAARLRTSYG